MIQTKRQIEGRVTEPSAFAIEKNRSVCAHQNVLRRDVAVYQAQLSVEGSLDKVLQTRRQIGMNPSGGVKIGLEAYRVENIVGGKPLP